jgi:hypothetical protein
MDEPTSERSSGFRGRLFKLTAKSSDEPTMVPVPERPSGKSRRKLLIAGSVAVPFMTRLASRPAFAKTSGKGGVGSLAGSVGHTKKKTGELAPGGDTVAMWRQNYPKLLQNHRIEASAFPAAVAGNHYLGNPALAAVFKVPQERVNGVALTAPKADLLAALHGHGTWEISVSHNGETARRTMDGGYFAEAAAAVLNAAVYGEKSFGMNDALVIEHVNRSLSDLQTKARLLAALKADAKAAEILNGVVGQIEGGFATRGEIHHLARLNTRGTA